MSILTTMNHPHWVGFNHLSSILERAETQGKYPPHNIVKVSDDVSIIELAVAGFTDEDISITLEESVLNIKGHRDDKRIYSYQGISSRDFDRSFVLAEYVCVQEVTCSNGILSILLKQKVPDFKKPQKISIKK